MEDAQLDINFRVRTISEDLLSRLPEALSGFKTFSIFLDTIQIYYDKKAISRPALRGILLQMFQQVCTEILVHSEPAERLGVGVKVRKLWVHNFIRIISDTQLDICSILGERLYEAQIELLYSCLPES